MITQEQLKQILHYNPDTGIFTNLTTRSSKAVKGKKAGCLNKGYIIITLNKKLYGAHRLAWLYMTGNWPINEIDHIINGNPSDNRFCNLRQATRSQNQMNRGKTKINSSGFKGVYYRKDKKKWHAQIRINKKSHYLGLFSTPEEAHEAYKKAAKELHKKFHNLG